MVWKPLVKGLANVAALQEVLNRIRKDVAGPNTIHHTSVQNLHSARRVILLLNIRIGYNMMIHAYARPEHRMATYLRGLMIVKAGKSSLVFVVEDLEIGELTMIHGRRMMPYPARKGEGHMLEQLHEQATCFDHPKDKISGDTKRKVDMMEDEIDGFRRLK